jgi:hypothetical protein
LGVAHRIGSNLCFGIGLNAENGDEPEPIFTEDTFDEYVGAELWVPTEGELAAASVTARKRDFGGNPVGVRDPNPVLILANTK